MTNNEIKDAISILYATANELENEYIENGGEMTESTESKEAQIEAVKELLNGEGIDSLGRWLKAKEDEKKSLKAEKDYISRRITACDNTIDYIKWMVGQVLRSTGQEKVKGSNGYAFAQYTSETTKADSAVLKDRYYEQALKAIHEAGIPDYVTLTLGASVSLVPEGAELPDVFIHTSTETCKFTKPRAAAKKEEEE